MSLKKREQIIDKQDARLEECKHVIGRELMLIDNGEEWAEDVDEDGYEMFGTMQEYLEDRCNGNRWAFSSRWATELMRAARTKEKLGSQEDDFLSLTISQLVEVSKLAPPKARAAGGTERDIDKLDVEAAKEVVERAKEISDNSDRTTKRGEPTVRAIREAVNEQVPAGKKPATDPTYKQKLLKAMCQVQNFIALINDAKPNQLEMACTREAINELNPDWQMIVELVSQYHEVKEMSE